MGDGPRKGRGATTNPAPRFQPYSVEDFDDGWGSLDEEPRRLVTSVASETCRSIITNNQSPDVPFSRSINPYRGCEHGCIYCFARPTHAYLDLSPGFDFESRLFAKDNAPDVLRATLSRGSYRPRTIALGVNTDAYQPIEKSREITRRLLEVFVEFRHPVSLITKSALVERDLDLLAELARHNLVSAMVSVTTLDRNLARRLEPRAAAPARRLGVIRSLTDAGVPTGVLAAPMIPGLSDSDLEGILEASREAGARAAGYILLRLPHELKELFAAWLTEHFPLRKERVLNLIRDTRGGELNQSEWGTRMRGVGAYADLLESRFRVARRRLDYELHLPELDETLFARPTRQLPPF